MGNKSSKQVPRKEDEVVKPDREQETSLLVTSVSEVMKDITDLIESLLNPDKDLDVKIQKLCEKSREFFNPASMNEMAYEMQKDLESWENSELHIAVIGETGAGKSSFINAMRGLKAGDVGAAPVGVTQTTLQPTRYENPSNPSVVFWDLPGIGAPEFRPKGYLEKVHFDRYDFFIILCSKRFQSIHTDLAQEIERKRKKFYFVRSRVDEDLTNMKRDYPQTFNEGKVLKDIRDDCASYLQDCMKSSRPRVFLISSCNLDRFDFNLLMETLEKDLPRLKKLKFLLSLPNLSPDFIQKKKEAIKKELWKISLVSTAFNAVPFPVISAEPVAFDAMFLQKYMVNIYKSFRLDTSSLALLAKHIKKPIEELKAHIQSSPEERIQRNVIVKKCSNIVLQLSGFFEADIVVATLMNAGSFIITYLMLLQFLDEVTKDAERVCEHVQKSVIEEFRHI